MMPLVQHLKRIYIIFLVTFMKKGDCDIQMTPIDHTNSFAKGEPITDVDLTEGRTCYLQKDAEGHRVRMAIAQQGTNIVAFYLDTSVEFLQGVYYVMHTAMNGFLEKDDLGKVKTSVKVKRGMCKVKGVVRKDTKIEHRFPVDDDLSWGKTVLTVEDWNTILEKLS